MAVPSETTKGKLQTLSSTIAGDIDCLLYSYACSYDIHIAICAKYFLCQEEALLMGEETKVLAMTLSRRGLAPPHFTDANRRYNNHVIINML